MTSSTDQGIILDTVSWTFFVITLIVFCMRLYADSLILRAVRLDTYIASVTFLTATASQIFTTLSVYHGMGQHFNSLNPAQIKDSLKWSWMAQISQLFANTTGKIAVLAYLRVIYGRCLTKANRAWLWTLGLLQIASIIVLIALILTQCSPLPKLWNEALPGTCNGRMRNQNFAFFQGSLSAFTDICLAANPIMMFWNLRRKLAEKVLLCCLFGLGLVATVSSIVKTSNLHRIGNTTDITYHLAYLIIWNAVDMYIVFIASSIPTLCPVFRKCFFKPIESDRRNTPLHGGDRTILKSASEPPGRVKTHASVAGRGIARQTENDDTAEDTETVEEFELTGNVEGDEKYEGIAK